MLLSEYKAQVQFLTHDASNADFSTAELTTVVNNARKAVALDMHCVRDSYLVPQANSPNVTLYRPVSTILNQEMYPLVGTNNKNGIVVGANVTNGGANYTAATTATFAAAPAGGVTALASPVIASGVITSINVTTWGTGYTAGTLPAVTITDSGGGSGAAATAVMFNNVFNVLSISYIWGNQRYMLRYLAWTLFQAYLRSQINFRQRGVYWTIHPQNNYVLISPAPDQAYQTEWDVLSTPMALVNDSDVDTQVLPPWDDAVQYYAAMLCLTKLQNFEQAEYMQAKYDKRVPRVITGAGEVRMPNPYNKTFQRRVMRR